MTTTVQAINTLIASRLGDLTYPGDEKNPAFGLPLPMFRTIGQPAEAAEAYDTLAKLTAASITHLIETDGGVTMVPNGELAALRAAAAANEHLRHRQARIYCHCGADLGKLNITDFDTDHPKVAGSAFIKHMHALSPECALGHRA